jgi:hypothetical protein
MHAVLQMLDQLPRHDANGCRADLLRIRIPPFASRYVRWGGNETFARMEVYDPLLEEPV